MPIIKGNAREVEQREFQPNVNQLTGSPRPTGSRRRFKSASRYFAKIRNKHYRAGFKQSAKHKCACGGDEE